MIVGDGWLRKAGDEFYAYSRPESIIVNEETGTTLAEVMGDFTYDQLWGVINSLYARYDELNGLLSSVLSGTTLTSETNGVYAIRRADLQNLLSKGQIDSNVMYVLVENLTEVSNVTINVNWLDKYGKVLTTDIRSQRIGSEIDFNLFRNITVDGVTHRYTKAGSPVIDRGTGTVCRQFDSSTNRIVATKNVFITLTEV